MYEGASGERFTIYCAKVKEPETALRFRQGDRFDAFYWVEGQAGYVVSGPAERQRLETVTKLIYEQIERNGARKS